MLPDNRFSITFEVKDIPGKPIIDRDTVLNKILQVLSQEIKLDVKYWEKTGVVVEIEDVNSGGLKRCFIPFTHEQNIFPQPILDDREAPKFYKCQP